MGCRLLLAGGAVAVWLVAPAAAADDAARLRSDFGTIDWCAFDPEQTDVDRIDLGVETIDGRTVDFVRVRADGELEDTRHNGVRPPGTACPTATAPTAATLPDNADALQLVRPVDAISAAALGQDANCPIEQPIPQRNEIRLDPRFAHPPEKGHWYGVRFRLGGAVPTCGSTRQIVAQWKFDYRDFAAKELDHSPVLALRVDNGILHATVQNGDCRCVVAQSEGDPDFRVQPVTANAAGLAATLTRYTPRCDRVVATAVGASTVAACKPTGLVAETLANRTAGFGGFGLPMLPDPRAEWVDIHAFIQAENEPGELARGRIDLYANGRFVARVSDGLGYSDGRAYRVRFKFGQYRNLIAARTTLDYDSVCVDPDPKVCGPTGILK